MTLANNATRFSHIKIEQPLRDTSSGSALVTHPLSLQLVAHNLHFCKAENGSGGGQLNGHRLAHNWL